MTERNFFSFRLRERLGIKRKIKLNTWDPRGILCSALQKGEIDSSQIPGRERRLRLLQQRADGTFNPYGKPLPEELRAKLLRIIERRGATSSL